ncbi:hypothetical protein Caci_3203 [Catenulispora acidiphila DSM 44928]|uniref:Uncharacterized protein n=1 Tax=Catenulispora acidiphila (strain DSM 44928 / JCM 14897 / NBRC 102108 / NRRL B-24433 / ID139908) TaxID=479433 RepID=C7Q6A4_CATAD|nr:hypothetical protein [Catenulispora acidiphila]ACU72110.1 hypothetical protein Caci_3203 [Catenulispora acidiphila DSM 44928]
MRAALLGLRGRALGWWVLLAAVVVVVAVNAALANWSRGSTSHGSASASAVSGPSMVRARSVATQEFGLLSGGGWGQAWGLWSAAGKAALSEADFVQLNTECRPALGEPYIVDLATDLDATTVRIEWHQGSTTGSGTVVYEGGAWKFQPNAQTLAAYRGGVVTVVAERKAAGECH